MSICYHEGSREFHLSNRDISYIITVLKNGQLGQLYFGKKLHDRESFAHLLELRHRPMAVCTYEGDSTFSMEHIKQEYPSYGAGDMRYPAVEILQENGSRITDFVYQTHRIYDGKPALAGLPATYTEDSKEAQTLEIELKDELIHTTLILYYTIFEELPAITRSAKVIYHGTEKIVLERAMSCSVDLPDHDYQMIELTGAWGRERAVTERKLQYGIQGIYSMRGCSSSNFNPFLALRRENTTEACGEVYGFSLVYSGNFLAQAEVDTYDVTRVTLGIHPDRFSWEMKNGDEFQTPEAVMVYSNRGLNGMSQAFHSLYRARLARGYWRDRPRPILINNWEATYFDFNEEKLIGLIGDAAGLGVDMFLLDDGWFANKYPRSSDHQGLGDWDETADKLPNGIGRLVEEATKKGIKFGLWIEPEMVNPKSELYEKHKDWVIHLPNRDEYYFRNQLVLDLSNPKVQDFVFGVVDDLMTKYPGIAFFKWDCNSPITNIYSSYLKEKQSHLYIDYVRGLYNVLERIKTKYPDLPMMLCSGGSGRIDYEALRYFTEFWPSDNTDPIERLFIQWGYSQLFPAKTLCAHVTTWNHDASIKFRTDVAMMGKLGFDIKLSDLNDNEKKFCRDAVTNYNHLKPVVLEGDMYRLVSPYSGNHTSTQYVGKDKKGAVVFAFDIYPRYGEKLLPVRLQGLDAGRQYRVKEINLMPGTNSSLQGNGELFSGEYLMTVGLNIFTGQRLNSRVIEVVAE